MVLLDYWLVCNEISELVVVVFLVCGILFVLVSGMLVE